MFMSVLNQYDYIFAIHTIFSFLDAWSIDGPDANNIANSLSTSVSSRTMRRAMAIAAVTEFSGSVTDTLRNNIIDPHLYDAQPSEVSTVPMLVVRKGVQLRVKFTPAQVLIAVLCIATGATLLQAFFLLPGPWLLNCPPTLSLPDALVASAVSDSRRSSSDLDAITLQWRNAVLFWGIADTYASAPHYDNRPEYMYSSLQILVTSAANGD
ncbi:uncharacterized protein LY79DRAFT_670789 [Colletotrichum navitas]|uniref:Uncharacterized protein n=1 Tax=Colletotrichum navitas TaxID=681940 RepID=A0AAD8V1W3_9PEZI|nr:uncharacterized protein LY79DRAFT_670789 [Colletotrichum navitas]KAK1585771.1 hypothetical protein LY79DRAFT_670789 [Colletotrichum navitas]